MSDVEERLERLKVLLEERGYALVGDYGRDELTEETRGHWVEESGYGEPCWAYISRRLDLYDSSLGDTAIVLAFRAGAKTEPVEGSITYSSTEASVKLVAESVGARHEVVKEKRGAYELHLEDLIGGVFGPEFGEITVEPPLILYRKGPVRRSYLDVYVSAHAYGEGQYRCEAEFEVTRIMIFRRDPVAFFYNVLYMSAITTALFSILSTLRNMLREALKGE